MGDEYAFIHRWCASAHTRQAAICDLPCCHIMSLRTCHLPLQAVFLGLNIVVPLMSGELLAVPKLARLYFALLSYMMDIWPARVAELPGAVVPQELKVL